MAREKMIYPDGSGKYVGAHYHSVADYIDALNTVKGTSMWRSFMEEGGGWYGDLNSGVNCIKACRDGWPEGVDRITKLVERISERATLPVSIRRRPCWGDQGHEVDMDRVRAGNLDHAWRRMNRRQASGPRSVRVVIDSIAFGGEAAETMQWRGIAAAAAANLLSSAGYRVELISAFRGYDSNGDNVVSVVIKSDTAPYSATEVAATCAPVFFRALGHTHAAVVGGNKGYGGYSVSSIGDASFIPLHDTYDEVLVVNQEIRSQQAAENLVCGLIERMNERNTYLQEQH